MNNVLGAFFNAVCLEKDVDDDYLEWSTLNVSTKFSFNHEDIIKKLQEPLEKLEELRKRCLSNSANNTALSEAINSVSDNIKLKIDNYIDCLNKMSKAKEKYIDIMNNLGMFKENDTLLTDCLKEGAYNANRHIYLDRKCVANSEVELDCHNIITLCNTLKKTIEENEKKHNDLKSEYPFYEAYKERLLKYKECFFKVLMKVTYTNCLEPSKVKYLTSYGTGNTFRHSSKEDINKDLVFKETYFGQHLGVICFDKEPIPQYVEDDKTFSNVFSTGDEIYGRLSIPHAIRNYPLGIDENNNPVYPPKSIESRLGYNTHVLTFYLYLYIDGKLISRSLKGNINSYMQAVKKDRFYQTAQTCDFALLTSDVDYFSDWNIAGTKYFALLLSKLPKGAHQIKLELHYSIASSEKNLASEFPIFPLEPMQPSETIAVGEFTFNQEQDNSSDLFVEKGFTIIPLRTTSVPLADCLEIEQSVYNILSKKTKDDVLCCRVVSEWGYLPEKKALDENFNLVKYPAKSYIDVTAIYKDQKSATIIKYSFFCDDSLKGERSNTKFGTFKQVDGYSIPVNEIPEGLLKK